MSGGQVDAVIAITVLETIALLAYHYTTKRSLTPRDYLLNVASGVCLMLALRCALSGSDWLYMSMWLVTAGMAHFADIAMRLRQGAQTRQGIKLLS